MKRQYESISTPPWQEWLDFREQFLLGIIEEKGSLTCEYCGKEDLDKDAPDYSGYLATIDHIIPTSKGGKKYDTSNFAVACRPCNRDKGDKFLHEWKGV